MQDRSVNSIFYGRRNQKCSLNLLLTTVRERHVSQTLSLRAEQTVNLLATRFGEAGVQELVDFQRYN